MGHESLKFWSKICRVKEEAINQQIERNEVVGLWVIIQLQEQGESLMKS